MQADKKILSFPVLSVLTVLLTGCAFLREPVEGILNTGSAGSDSTAVSKRFQGSGTNAQTAVDSAIELAKKNSELSEVAAGLKQKIQELAAENQRLKGSIAVLEPELEQTKKELAQANDLLIEMRIELNNWKTDILGFRNEIRDADKVQLQTLRRILEVLGGKIEAEISKTQDQNSTVASLIENDKP